MHEQDGDYEDDEDSLKEGIGECDETVEHLKREVDRLDDAVRRDQEKAVVHKNEYAKVCPGVLQTDERRVMSVRPVNSKECFRLRYQLTSETDRNGIVT